MSEHFLDEYELGPTLGKGAFGEVKVAMNIHTSQEVAIKIIDRSTLLSDYDRTQLQEEIRIHQHLDHRNIVKLYDVIEKERYTYMVLEYVAGQELFHHINGYGTFAEPDARRIFHQIIDGVAHMHGSNTAHRDIKLENILVDRNANVKIVDLGLAVEFSSGELLTQACGTVEYAAPEIVSPALRHYEGPDVDVWSCGVVLFALLCGRLPFEGQSPSEIKRGIVSGCVPIPDFVSSDAADLLRRMLCVDRTARIKLADVQQHSWFVDAIPAAASTRETDTCCSTSSHMSSSSTASTCAPSVPSTSLLSTSFVLGELGKDNASQFSDDCVVSSRGLSTCRRIKPRDAAHDDYAVSQIDRACKAAACGSQSECILAERTLLAEAYDSALLSADFVLRELGQPSKEDRSSSWVTASVDAERVSSPSCRLRFREAQPLCAY